MRKLSRVFCWLIYLLPLSLFFSYHPVISLGANETMNFELSIPLLWLVVFDLVGLVILCKKRILWRGFRCKWMWLLFPIWLTISLIWSVNVVRGALTMGIVWLIVFAIYVMWSMRELYDEKFKRQFWKWFFGSTIFVCIWCVVQCVLDIAGVGRDYSLMCAGCTYKMFGFPHPNGFAIEPQFMGNLLLAPAIVAAWFMIMNTDRTPRSWLRLVGLFAIILVTLFLTMSRGAIYAFVVGLIFLTVFWVVRKRKKWQKVWRKIGGVWLTVAAAFLMALGVQGLMAELSSTNDTFGTGVAKVLNHLSLGLIDIRSDETEKDTNVVVEKSVENFSENRGGDGMLLEEIQVPTSETEEAIFDGYVAESTDTRVRLTGAAMQVWSQDVRTAMFGVGLGGAGQALYDNGLSSAPKEIVQNEYASLLLETGTIGLCLFVLTVGLAIRLMIKSSIAGMILALMVAYGISLCFFSGIANALQVYLMPMALLLWGATIKNDVK